MRANNTISYALGEVVLYVDVVEWGQSTRKQSHDEGVHQEETDKEDCDSESGEKNLTEETRTKHQGEMRKSIDKNFGNESGEKEEAEKETEERRADDIGRKLVLRFSVRDTGIGIAPNILPTIFEQIVRDPRARMIQGMI